VPPSRHLISGTQSWVLTGLTAEGRRSERRRCARSRGHRNSTPGLLLAWPSDKWLSEGICIGTGTVLGVVSSSVLSSIGG
jgi:hypothetical protein